MAYTREEGDRKILVSGYLTRSEPIMPKEVLGRVRKHLNRQYSAIKYIDVTLESPKKLPSGDLEQWVMIELIYIHSEVPDYVLVEAISNLRNFEYSRTIPVD